MWDLIVSVPDHCLSFYFDDNNQNIEKDTKLQVVIACYNLPLHHE